MKAVISRTYNATETIGTISVWDGERPVLSRKTIELPDNGNQKNTSCIPEGAYDVEKITSSTRGEVFYVKDVPGRTGILIHKGNYAAGSHVDTLGCILPGMGFEDINDDGNIDVFDSTRAMNDLLAVLPDKFKVTII